MAEFKQFLADLIDQYASSPDPGMLSGMVNDDGPEGRMPEESIINNACSCSSPGMRPRST